MENGFVDPRQKRQIHEENDVPNLLAVPRHADVLEGAAEPEVESDGDRCMETRRAPVLVTSSATWRRQLAKWST